MLVYEESLKNAPVLSLHVGGEIARTEKAIIDPNNLKVIGFTLDSPLIKDEVGNILQVKDVREYSPSGFIVDSIDEFVKREDIMRLDEVMSLNFELIGLKVVTKKGTKLGRVCGFAVNSENFMVQQLIVRRPAMKAFLDPELIIGRSQVVEVNDYKLVVKDEEKKIREEAARKDFVPNFVNPFREAPAAAVVEDEDE